MSESRLAAFGLCVRWVADDALAPDSTTLLGVHPIAAVDATPDLTVRIRQGAPPPPATSAPSFFHGTVEGHIKDGEALLLSPGAAVRVSPDGSVVDVSVHGPRSEDPALGVGVPLFIGLAIALRHRGLFHLHAASLAHADHGGLLVIGQQGAGKTSTCLALLEAGWSFAGDDAVFLSQHEGSVVAYGVPKPFHVGEATRRAFGRLTPLCGPLPADGPPKRPLDPLRAWPAGLVRTLCAPFAIVFPTITSAPTSSLDRVDAAEAFGLLLESSALGVVDGMPALAEQLALLQQLAAPGRAWHLHLGADALARPAVVPELLERAMGDR